MSRFLKIMSNTYSQQASKLPIIPIKRESFVNSIVRLEKSTDETVNQSILSLKDLCTRHLLLHFGDTHTIYSTYLSTQLVRYVTYDYLTFTNNIECRNHDEILSESKFLCCRDCSVNNLGASKCHRRKCLANRVRQMLSQLSSQIIPWQRRKLFTILENDDDDDDEPIVFIYLKSSKSTSDKQNDRSWIEDQFYLLDLLRILRVNIYRE